MYKTRLLFALEIVWTPWLNLEFSCRSQTGIIHHKGKRRQVGFEQELRWSTRAAEPNTMAKCSMADVPERIVFLPCVGDGVINVRQLDWTGSDCQQRGWAAQIRLTCA